MRALELIDGWDVQSVGVAVATPDGVLAARGDLDVPVRIASVSKLLSAYAVMIGVEEGAVELDEPAGPPGATVRHLLAHAAGYGFESNAGVIAAPGTRRVYSNRGFEEVAGHLEAASGIPFAEYLSESVLAPLGMTATRLAGSPASGVVSTVDDLCRFVAELFRPRLLARVSLDQMRAVQFPGLAGVLPGVGSYPALDWGLGFERNFSRPKHWAGSAVSADTFGHFGGSGTFAWVDPAACVACVCLTSRDFGPWALQAWPALGDAILAECTS